MKTILISLLFYGDDPGKIVAVLPNTNWIYEKAFHSIGWRRIYYSM